jgi:hypothetical protein
MRPQVDVPEVLDGEAMREDFWWETPEQTARRKLREAQTKKRAAQRVAEFENELKKTAEWQETAKEAARQAKKGAANAATRKPGPKQHITADLQAVKNVLAKQR